MKMEYQVLTFIIVLIVIRILGQYLNIIINSANIKYRSNYLTYGYLSRSYLSKLPFSIFEKWCVKLLQSCGYTDVNIVEGNYKFQRDIMCKEDDKQICVRCSLEGLIENNTSEDDFSTVGKPEIQKLIGEMIHDGILNSIIITTGDFTDDALEYIRSLQPKYNIRVIDGIELTKLFRLTRKRYIANVDF